MQTDENGNIFIRVSERFSSTLAKKNLQIIRRWYQYFDQIGKYYLLGDYEDPDEFRIEFAKSNLDDLSVLIAFADYYGVTEIIDYLTKKYFTKTVPVKTVNLHEI